MAADDPEILPPELIDKFSAALVQITRGDPVVALRSELAVRFGAISTRLEAMDKATDLQHQDMVRVPTLLMQAIGNLRDLLHQEMMTIEASLKGELAKNAVSAGERFDGSIAVVNEKITSLANVTTQQFKSIDDKFAEKDKAVSVGLSAQKESATAQQDSNNTATRKMEDNFTKLLDQGRDLLAEVRRNTETQITDIKSRLDKGEGRTGGGRDNMALIIALVVAGAAVAGLFVQHTSPPQPVVQYVPAPTAVPAPVTVPR
jgi:hypothetical protein